MNADSAGRRAPILDEVARPAQVRDDLRGAIDRKACVGGSPERDGYRQGAIEKPDESEYRAPIRTRTDRHDYGGVGVPAELNIAIAAVKDDGFRIESKRLRASHGPEYGEE
jgi:hypothetical protein